MKKETQITQMRRFAPRLRSSHLLFVARHPAQSWAGGVAIASATANAREAIQTSQAAKKLRASIWPQLKEDIRITHQHRKKASRAFLAAFATATPPARLRAGWRAALRKCDERSRCRRRHLRYLRCSFLVLPTQKTNKKWKYATHHTKKG